MTVAELHERRSPLGRLGFALQRERALIALFDRGRQGVGFQFARLYAVGVGSGYAIAISLAAGPNRRALIHGFVASALSSLSWVVGALSSLGAAKVLAGPTDRDALSTLALQRGIRRASLDRARTLAAAARIARLIAVPALLLVALGIARGSTLPWALSVAPALVIYAALLGLALAWLAHFSAGLAPRRPRALLLLLVLGPWLISLAYPAVPSVPSAFSRLLGELLSLGASAS